MALVREEFPAEDTLEKDTKGDGVKQEEQNSSLFCLGNIKAPFRCSIGIRRIGLRKILKLRKIT